MNIYYTPITIDTICKNGSERFGAVAITKFGTSPEGKLFEVEMSGGTKKAAEEKLLNFLTGNGTNTAIQLEASPEPPIPTAFTEWADDYFNPDNSTCLNTIISRNELYNDFRALTHITIPRTLFKQYLELWARSKNYVLNPKNVLGNRDRIIVRIGEQIKEAFFISSNNHEQPVVS